MKPRARLVQAASALDVPRRLSPAFFITESRAEWREIMEYHLCFAPVLSLLEAPHHPHNVARETFVELDGVTTAAPAPRFSAKPSAIQHGFHGRH
jgi:alpha-methylacyl-CoA racemase